MTSDDLLQRLRDPSPDGPLVQLAELVVDQQLSRPVRDAVNSRQTAELLRAALNGWCSSDDAEQQLVAAWRSELDRLGAETGLLGEQVPDGVRAEIRKLAAEPYAPDRDLLLALLDRAPFRALIRELLVETLQNFAQRLSNPVADSRVAKTVRGLGKRARDRARSHTGSLGTIADAVTEGVERQLERRVSEFADSALSTVLQRIADYLCSPDRAADQVALRLGFLDGLWELRTSTLATELARTNLEATAKMVHASIQSWVEQPDFEDQAARWIEARLEALGDRPVGEVLDDFQLLDSIREYTIERAGAELRDLVESEAFGSWLHGVASD